MKHQILDSPDFAMLELVLDAGDSVVAESGAMVAKDSQIELSTNMRGSFLHAAKRKLLGGESLFQNTFRATANGQRLYLAAAAEGDLKAHVLAAGEALFLQSGAYVAHVGSDLVLDTHFAGLKSFFSGVGFFMLRVQGPGTVFYGSYGALHEIEVGPEGYSVDTGHITAFSGGLDYQVRPFGGFKGLFFSGEGLVCQFSGSGKVWVQTRDASGLAAFLHPFRRVKSNSS
ncbi:MAG TPA: TIGR00266 family protein [Polyangiaceae bacterium]|nr:TIGR00266 family protein [Polyangiaceae bacterium]